MTNEKPHKETIILINFKSLWRFKDRAKGIANTQLIKADKKAWYNEKKIILCV